jgi:type I restriction enzyme, S subunit
LFVTLIHNELLINDTKIPVPDKAFQLQITDLLAKIENEKVLDMSLIPNEFRDKVNKVFTSKNAVFEIAAELTHQRTLLKQLRQQLLQDAVQGKLVKNTQFTEGGETGSQLLERIKKEKAQLIKDKKIKKEKDLPPIKAEDVPFEIPEDWVWCRLGEICESRLGKMLDGIKNKGDFYPYLRNLNVRWYDFNLDDVLEMKFEKSELEEYSIKKGDLLICEGGYPGRAAIWESDNESYKFQKALHRVRFLGNLSSWFYLYYLDFLCCSEKINAYFTASGIQHFTGKSLKEMPVPLPPLSIQQAIVRKVGDLMTVCDSLEASIGASVEQNEALLQQVLREALG